MTPLLEAAYAARQAGLSVPRCVRCARNEVLAARPREPAPWMCNYCCDTDINPDPERLIGLATLWLWLRNHNVTDAEYLNISAAARDHETGCGVRGLKLADDYKVERHDGSSAGIATALLRLLARAGTAP